MSDVITGIGELMTQDGDHTVLHDAALVIEEGLVAWVGSASAAPAADHRTDLGGRALLPGWVDSHSHLVFDGDRSAEFEARMAGESYSAGGIAVTTAVTRAAGDERLARLVAGRVREALGQGTTWLETKTGYGLTVDDEVRGAVIAASEVGDATFLGAHLVPDGLDPDDYVDLVCGPMLAGVAPHVRWADVFCEQGAFTVEQSRRVLTAARATGLGLRVHGNQLGHSGGIRLAVEVGAASVDHCNFVSDDDLDALASSWTSGRGTVATVLPACDLSTRAPLAPARRLLDAGVPVAIASNCNPGTSYTSSMAFCVATAVLQMGLSIHEAVRAATHGGALALHRDAGPGAIGSIAVGHRADLHALDAPSATHLAYRPGMPLTYAVWKDGRRS
ncbi:imidazolonepropionase [Rathayibacter tanaceti]|uniref:Imidazolonepropionase n=2 Tax=Rathayibacter tanaceti TaxID=1671680 RepID=A0A166I3Q3_9MICO|nr:imidazolonepropionase [Rathayibacter tanaceti]KZX21582.1 Imidazolonepropionase [Rathayibacter tanaceti]QHC56637.1 imidazolonepropionase [Rathayibacter tanaceti]TCO36218.1 imidazolonepropionase [Rathayibacter tanaceti]